MKKNVDKFFFLLWKILSPISFVKFIFSPQKSIDKKKSYLGKLPELETISNLINLELFNSNEFNKKIKTAKESTDLYGFSFDCYEFLSNQLRNKIYNFAKNNSKITNLTNSFLGLNGTLNTISIYANVPRASDLEIGSKMWHRDGNTYLAADFMFAISEINDENGPFYWIDPKDFGHAQHYKSDNHIGWESSGRFTDENLFNFGLKKDKIQKFIGKPGSYILLNTGESFHKGGFCNTQVRILGRFVYSSFGYSKGNLHKYNNINENKRFTFPISHRLYTYHEKIFRNIINKIK